MVHRHHEEPPRPASRIQNDLSRLGIYHLYRHSARVTRGKEFATVTAEVTSNHFLIGNPFDVYGRVKQRILLHFTHHIGESSAAHLQSLIALEYCWVFGEHTISEHTVQPRLHASL